VQPTAAWLTVNVRPPIAIVPTRGVMAVFAAAENETVPVPLPLAPPVTVSQAGVPVTAVHAHPDGAVMVVVPVAVPDAIETLAGASEYVHGAAAWVTVTVRPPIEIVACRVCVSGLASAANVTVPSPLPLAPVMTTSHDGALLTADHPHPSGEVTVVVPVAPAAAKFALVGDTAYVHGAGA
jgi:hypothetical protein